MTSTLTQMHAHTKGKKWRRKENFTKKPSNTLSIHWRGKGMLKWCLGPLGISIYRFILENPLTCSVHMCLVECTPWHVKIAALRVPWHGRGYIYYVAYKPITILFILFKFIKMKYIHCHLCVMFAMICVWLVLKHMVYTLLFMGYSRTSNYLKIIALMIWLIWWVWLTL